MATGTESGRERDKRHFQRNLFDGIADRYEASRPGYAARVVEFVTASAGLGAAVLEIGCGTAFSKSARLLRPGGWLALLGTEERCDEPLGAALDQLWITHGDTGGAWERRPSDPEAVAATGLFETPAVLTDSQRTTLPATDVIALESTRATFLSWPRDTQRQFTADLRRLLEPQPTVHLTRRTPVTMAEVLRAG